jgi:glycosyltransferase 2 family protein
MSRTSQKRTWRGLALRIGVSAAVLALLFHFLPLAEVWAALRRLPASLWTLVVAGYLAAHLVGVTKWRLMVNLGGARLRFRDAMRCYFSGLFSTLLLPSVIGGDVVRAGLALRLGRSKAAVILGSFLDRLIDSIALGLLMALGAVLVPGALSPDSRRVFTISGVAILLFLIVAALVAAWFPARRFSFGIRRRLVRLRHAAHSVRRQPQYVAAALCLGLIVQGSFIWLTSQVAAASGLHLLFRAWLFAWPLAKLSALVPLTQGGIGVREAALAVLLVPFGARATVTVAVGLAWEAVIISGGLIAGLAALLLGRFSAAPAPAENSRTARESSPLSRS